MRRRKRLQVRRASAVIATGWLSHRQRLSDMRLDFASMTFQRYGMRVILTLKILAKRRHLERIKVVLRVQQRSYRFVKAIRMFTRCIRVLQHAVRHWRMRMNFHRYVLIQQVSLTNRAVKKVMVAEKMFSKADIEEKDGTPSLIKLLDAVRQVAQAIEKGLVRLPEETEEPTSLALRRKSSVDGSSPRALVSKGGSWAPYRETDWTRISHLWRKQTTKDLLKLVESKKKLADADLCKATPDLPEDVIRRVVNDFFPTLRAQHRERIRAVEKRRASVQLERDCREEAETLLHIEKRETALEISIVELVSYPHFSLFVDDQTAAGLVAASCSLWRGEVMETIRGKLQDATASSWVREHGYEDQMEREGGEDA